MSWILHEWGFLVCMETVCQVGLRSLEGTLGFELWVRLSDTTASPLMCCQNKHHHLFLGVFIPWHFIWGFVYVDSVWSAAHSQPSALQYPILVQPQSSGTPEPCPTAEPRTPLPGNSHLFLFPCMCTGCLQQLQIFAKPLLNLKIS